MPGLSGTARNPPTVSLPLGNSTVCVFAVCARTARAAAIKPKAASAEMSLTERFMLRCLPYEQTVHCKPVGESAPCAIEVARALRLALAPKFHSARPRRAGALRAAGRRGLPTRALCVLPERQYRRQELR